MTCAAWLCLIKPSKLLHSSCPQMCDGAIWVHTPLPVVLCISGPGVYSMAARPSEFISKSDQSLQLLQLTSGLQHNRPVQGLNRPDAHDA